MDLKECRKKYQNKYFENGEYCFHIIKILEKDDGSYSEDIIWSISDIIDKSEGKLMEKRPWVFYKDFIQNHNFKRSNKFTFNNNIRKIKKT